MSYDREFEVRCDKCGKWHSSFDDRFWGMCKDCYNKGVIL